MAMINPVHCAIFRDMVQDVMKAAIKAEIKALSRLWFKAFMLRQVGDE